MIYDEQVTYMELLAAEPFCLGLVCFILQSIEEGSEGKKDGKVQGHGSTQRRSMFIRPAFQPTARVAVRGIITLFAMPLTAL